MSQVEPNGTGVIVGRFQTYQLHQGHVNMIRLALSQCERVIIFVGVNPLGPTMRSPLPFIARQSLILEMFRGLGSKLVIIPLKDTAGNDALWLKNIEEAVASYGFPGEVRAYTGRDSSFANVLKLRASLWPIIEENTQPEFNSTEMRAWVMTTTDMSSDFRKGIIYGQNQNYPPVYTTVDALIYSYKFNKFLLGKRSTEDKWRIIGGFFEAKDKRLIRTVIREVEEETGLVEDEISDVHYIGEHIVDDYRLRGDKEKILTHLHVVTYEGDANHAKGADDIAQVAWFTIKELEDVLIGNHLELYLRYEDKIKRFLSIK